MLFFRSFRPVALAAPVVLLAACTTAPEQTTPSPVALAEQGLMARHDSLMAQMDQLLALKARIAAAHSPTAGPYLRGLTAADAAMMGWMHQYRAPDTTAAPAARLAYFQQQQQVLADVRQQFRATIDSAAGFIRLLPAATTPAAAPAP